MVCIENLAGLRFKSDIWVSTPATKYLECSDQIFAQQFQVRSLHKKFKSDLCKTRISPPFAGISVQHLLASTSGLETCWEDCGGGRLILIKSKLLPFGKLLFANTLSWYSWQAGSYVRAPWCRDNCPHLRPLLLNKEIKKKKLTFASNGKPLQPLLLLLFCQQYQMSIKFWWKISPTDLTVLTEQSEPSDS